jgi:hypothetical protein
LTRSEIDTLRIYIAQISTLNISIQEEIAEEMQNGFIRARKETAGEGIDEAWLGRRIVVAKGLTRIDGHDSVTKQDWQESLNICLQWESRRKER